MIRGQDKLIGLLDLDAMVHVIAHGQYNAGNRDNAAAVRQHVFRFISTIKLNSKCSSFVSLYQKGGHKNFRNEILPEYKGHREPREAVTLWRPTIQDAFESSGALGLSTIESDDAQSVLARAIGPNKVMIVSSDKDMKQVHAQHYNPYKKGSALDLSRWFYSSEKASNKFFWQQVLSGDSTDMPNSLCGLPGIGEKKAQKFLDECKDGNYLSVIQKKYTEAFGPKEGRIRAVRTMRMTRLLDGSPADNYASEAARDEVKYVIDNWKEFQVEKEDNITALFGTTSIQNLGSDAPKLFQ